MKKSDLIIHRPYELLDEAFVYSTWLKGLRYGNQLFELIDADIYFHNYRKVIAALLANSDTKIACLKEDPSVIIGYSVTNGNKVHWIHIKENWRTMGIAQDLLPSPFRIYTHTTKRFQEIIDKNKLKDLIFNPFL